MSIKKHLQLRKAITLKDALDETQHWLFCDLDRIQGEKNGKIETIRLSPEEQEKVALALLEGCKDPRIVITRKGEVVFNECAKKYAIESEIRDEVELLLGLDLLHPPEFIILTDSVRELVELNPHQKITALEIVFDERANTK